MSGQIGMGFYGASDPTTMADVYKGAWRKDVDALEKLASDGTVGITTSAAFNAYYGPKVFNLAYNRHNTLAALGAKPYFTGVRFQQELSSAGMTTNGGVIRGGYRRAPKIAKYATVEEPYKVNEWNFAMEFGMIAINGIDDVLKWEQQMDLEAKTWLNKINEQILTKVESAPSVGVGQFPADSQATITSTERVGLESIERIISNYAEAQCLPDTYAIPWYSASNLPSSEGNMLAPYRSVGGAGGADSNFDAYVDANYDATNLTGPTNRQLNLSMIDNMFNTCMPFWEDNGVDGKVLITGYDTMTKLQAILQPQQRYQDAVFAKMSVNGISTVEGRGAGFQVASYNGVPILPDRQVPKGTFTSTASGTAVTISATNNDGVGRIYLVDTANLARGIAKATTINISDNPLITDVYSRVCNMYDLSELQCTGFRGQGKIIHLK